MRILITILLLFCLNAEGQVIRANAYYTPFAPSLLLDIYPNAAAAYSLRKLRTAYTGAAIRVRKDTTGQPEIDINFDSNGNLDTVALKSFINARSAYIARWYDQSGNGRNASMGTQSLQPLLANTGIIVRNSGKVSIDQTGGKYLFYNYSVTVTGQAYMVWTSSDNVNMIPFGSSASPSSYYGAIDGSGSSTSSGFGTPTYYVNNSSALTNTRVSLRTAYITGSIVLSYATNLAFNSAYVSYSSTYYHGGGFDGSNFLFEYIMYPNTTDNRSGISSNINSYYGIY